jgi:hypothetical protein
LLLALLTLGLGFASGEPLGLVAGAVAYALGLIYLPDSRWFKSSVEQKQSAAAAAEARVQREAFARERDRLLGSLPAAAQQRFEQLVALTREIEAATADAQASTGPSLAVESRLRKLDELAWTYLRLLAIEHTLETFLESERRERLPEQIEQAAAEITALEPIAAADPNGPRAKLLQSKRDRVLALRERLMRGDQARAHLELAHSEQQRLMDQLKLLRADLLATHNADALSSRIDRSVEHLTETNRWLGELAEFRDLTASLPPGMERLDFGGSMPAQRQRLETKHDNR